MVNYTRKRLKTRDKKDGGTVVGEQLTKTVRGSRHMLRNPRGWAIDIAILEKARKLGVTEVVIIDVETEWIYCAPLSFFYTNAEYIERHHGPQKCVPLQHWVVYR